MDPVKIYPGALVYLETMRNGLVPAKYTGSAGTLDSVDRQGRAGVTVRITATRGAYARGEDVAAMPDRVIPRGNVRTRRGNLIVTGLWAGWSFMVPVGGDEYRACADSHNRP